MISEIDQLRVDIYCPREGSYGCPTLVSTLEQAAAEVARLRRGGYGGPGTHSPSVIQVRRVRVDRIPLEDLPKVEDCSAQLTPRS